MLWWIALLTLVAYVVHTAWKTYRHPATALLRQAVHMNWAATGRRKDDKGFYDTLLKRGGAVAEISYQHKDVRLIKPDEAGPFRDFLELERWLATEEERRLAGDPLIQYYRAVQKYIAEHGLAQRLFELQGTDEEYAIATYRVQVAGYNARKSYKVVGAFLMESVRIYAGSREFALAFLKALENEMRPIDAESAD